MKTYHFNQERAVLEYIDGSLSLVDYDGNVMQSDVDLVVGSDFNGKDRKKIHVMPVLISHQNFSSESSHGEIHL